MKRIMLQPGPQAASLRSAALYVVRSGKAAVRGDAGEAPGWDGGLGTVNEETSAVAHWHLVMSNLALLVPYLPGQELAYLADVVVRNLLLRGSREVGPDPANPLSIPAMCQSLINSSVLPEVQPLHREILHALLERVRGLVSLPDLDVPARLLEQLGDGGETRQGGGNQRGNVSESPASHPQGSPLLLARDALSAKSPSLTPIPGKQLDLLLRSLDVLSALSLDSLSGADHLRCFLLLVSLVTAVRPSSGKSKAPKALRALSKCYTLLTVLQTGANANVVFKLAHAGDILEKVTAPLLRVSGDLAGCEGYAEFLGAVERFLAEFIQAVVERKQSMRLNLEQFVAFLSAVWLSSKETGEWRSVAEHSLSVALSTLSQILVNSLQCSEKARHKGTAQHSLLTQLMGLLGPVLQSLLDKGGRLDLALTMPYVAGLLQAELCLKGLEDGVPTEGESPDARELQYTDLYRRTCLQVLHQLTSPTEDLELLQKQLEFLRAFCSASELCTERDPRTSVAAVLCAVKALLAAPWMTVEIIQPLDLQFTGLLQCLAERCTEQQFYLIVKSTTQGLEVSNLWKGQHQDVASSLILTTLLLKCSLSGDMGKAVWFTTPQIIAALLVLCKETAVDQPWGCKVILLSLETLAVFLQQGEGILSNPHHVTLVFDALLCVPLDQLRPDEYGAIFRAIQEVLFSILQFQPKVLLNAASSFLKCFNRLVISIMHKGCQKYIGEKGTTTESEVILECARLVERMYTRIASKTEEFAMFSAFSVAQYVNELQKVTLNADVKRHLTEGIYHLLDLVTEHDLRFLNALLQTGVREVFKELYNNYTHYHKTKRQGEEKYTA